MKNETFEKIKREYGTPCFVFDAAALRERAGAINSMLKEHGIDFVYSIKANPFLIPVLIDHVDAFEVCSPGELSICKHLHVPGAKIIYSGVNKQAEDVAEAVNYESGSPVRILTAESVRHYELIRKESEKSSIKVDVILRLSAQNQFGMSEEDIESILSKNKDCSFVNIIGIHYFVGTQRKKLSHQQKELVMLKEFITRLRADYGLPLDMLEYGPGLPHPYFVGEDFSDTLSPLKELLPDLAQMTDMCKLSVEMGRFLASSCGYYMTSVADVKESFDHNWCIVDGGINHVNYLGSMMGLSVPVIRKLGNENSSGQMTHCTLCGSLCTTNDVLVRDYESEKLSIGDTLVFENIGAYSITEGLNLFLSRNMPKVVIADGNDITLVRDTVHAWKINSKQ